MYGIKRNIKKLNNSNAVANTPQRKTLKANGFGRYKLPVYDEVPAGPYFSKVVNVRDVETATRKVPALEVLYKMKYGYTCSKIVNGILPEDAENKTYYIKQIYPEGTTYHNDFLDAMSEALGLNYGDDFSYEDIKGVTEYVKIAYETNSDLGGIKVRCPMSWDEFLELCHNKTESDEDEEDTYDDVDYDEYEDD